MHKQYRNCMNVACGAILLVAANANAMDSSSIDYSSVAQTLATLSVSRNKIAFISEDESALTVQVQNITGQGGMDRPFVLGRSPIHCMRRCRGLITQPYFTNRKSVDVSIAPYRIEVATSSGDLRRSCIISSEIVEHVREFRITHSSIVPVNEFGVRQLAIPLR